MDPWKMVDSPAVNSLNSIRPSPLLSKALQKAFNMSSLPERVGMRCSNFLNDSYSSAMSWLAISINLSLSW